MPSMELETLGSFVSLQAVVTLVKALHSDFATLAHVLVRPHQKEHSLTAPCSHSLAVLAGLPLSASKCLPLFASLRTKLSTSLHTPCAPQPSDILKIRCRLILSTYFSDN